MQYGPLTLKKVYKALGIFWKYTITLVGTNILVSYELKSGKINSPNHSDFQGVLLVKNYWCRKKDFFGFHGISSWTNKIIKWISSLLLAHRKEYSESIHFINFIVQDEIPWNKKKHFFPELEFFTRVAPPDILKIHTSILPPFFLSWLFDHSAGGPFILSTQLAVRKKPFLYLSL